MTVEVAVMNSRGVAIAADSAVTLGHGSKVFYTAEKIFRLHKDLPVGVMIYGSSRYMDELDWEIIIKEYAKDLKGRPFDTLEQHAEDFIKFVRTYRYVTPEMEKRYFSYFVDNLVEQLSYWVEELASEKPGVEKSKLLDEHLRHVIKSYESDEDIDPRHEKIDDDFVDLNFKHLHDNIINGFKRHIGVDISSKKQKDMLKKIMRYRIIKIYTGKDEGAKHRLLTSLSGIVFAGYGEKEIFPAVCRYNVFGKLGKEFIYGVGSEKIEESGESSILPFAQEDVINLFVDGIDDDLSDFIGRSIGELTEIALEKLPKKDVEMFKKASDEVFESISDYIGRNLASPMYRIVANLPGINLAEVAESLVNITTLRRHNTTDENTVGGPTDVALITKGDGFRWIKNKNGEK